MKVNCILILGYYTEYNDLDAEGFTMIHFLKKGELMNNRFMSAFIILPDPNEKENKFILVSTLENLIYLSFKSKKKVINCKLMIRFG